MKKQFLLGLAALLVLLAACAVIPQQPVKPKSVACTEDAKLCPDGSAVGRVPPDCEFSPCPEPSKDACETDADCICDGIDLKTGDCFVGNKDYYDLFVNKEQQCPDFCSGIAGNLGTKCVDQKCHVVQLEPMSGTIPCTTVADCASVADKHPDVQCIQPECAPCPPSGECLPCPRRCVWGFGGPSLKIIAEPPSGEMPLFVKFTATLEGAEPNDVRFYCVGKHWTYGDGVDDPPEPAVICVPPPSDFKIQTVYETDHRYEQPGIYEVLFKLGNLASQPILVTVLPERFPPECDEDNDCVPAQCCHAADCIIKEKRTDCSEVFCTQECRPGTLDCGGSCACIAGRCSGKGFVPGKDMFNGPRPWQAVP